jgi:hypothetical protein
MRERFCRVCDEVACAYDYRVFTRYAGRVMEYTLTVCYHCREILETMLVSGSRVSKVFTPETSYKMETELVG